MYKWDGVNWIVDNNMLDVSSREYDCYTLMTDSIFFGRNIDDGFFYESLGDDDSVDYLYPWGWG